MKVNYPARIMKLVQTKPLIMQKNNIIKIVDDRKDLFQKVLNIIGRICLILVLLSFSFLFIDRLNEYFSIFFSIIFSVILILAIIVYYRKSYIFIGSIEFLNDSINVVYQDNIKKYLVNDIRKIEISVYKYQNQVDLVPGNFLLHYGASNYVRLTFSDKSISYNFFLENNIELLNFKDFSKLWAKEKGNVTIISPSGIFF